MFYKSYFNEIYLISFREMCIRLVALWHVLLIWQHHLQLLERKTPKWVWYSTYLIFSPLKIMYTWSWNSLGDILKIIIVVSSTISFCIKKKKTKTKTKTKKQTQYIQLSMCHVSYRCISDIYKICRKTCRFVCVRIWNCSDNVVFLFVVHSIRLNRL